jgi:hypothetical protein
MSFFQSLVVDDQLHAELCRESAALAAELRHSLPEPFTPPRTPVKVKPGTRMVPPVRRGQGPRQRWAKG